MQSAVQVKRTLLGGVQQDSGYLGAKSRDLRQQFDEARSIVESWAITEFDADVNVVENIFLLGKDTSCMVYLDASTMSIAKLKL